MLARLQRDTSLYHGDADGHRLALVGGAVTPERYRGFLGRIYGFEMPVEVALALTLGLDDVLDLRARGQIRLLRADLLALGVLDASALPRCRSISIPGVPEALGWAFALERNTALHGIVERHVRERIPEPMRTAGSYFAVQDRSAGTRLRELGEAMDRVATRPTIAARITNGAKAAFRCQRSWYDLVVPPGLRVA